MEDGFDESGKIYKEYLGRPIDQMAGLVSGGMVPMSVSQVMQKRIECMTDSIDVGSFWLNNHVNTSDAVVYYPNGDVGVVLDCPLLKGLSWVNRLDFGRIILDEDSLYKSLRDVKLFGKGSFEKTLCYGSEEIKFHPILRTLARDKSLLSDYADFIAEVGGRDYCGSNKEFFSCGEYSPVFSRNYPLIGMWRIGEIFDSPHISGDRKYNRLDDLSDRLVGVMSNRGNSASGNCLENKIN